MLHIVALEGQALILQLLVLLKMERGVYMNKIVKERFGATRRATVYRAVRTLEKSGLITSTLQDVGGIGGIRREFFLTPAGEEIASHLVAVESVLKSSRKDRRRRRKMTSSQ
jgi:DNA-binding PadR family transcriptional regulator